MRASRTLPRDLRRLHSSLADAPDALLAKVVAVVDALDSRGVADDMIAPLRPRLAQLRPRRPLRFCRLLFMPLDPLIAPAPDWQPDHPTIPRSALLPIADTVRAALGSEAPTIDAMLSGCVAEDDTVAATAGTVAATAGRILWPQAARILAATAQPSSPLTQRVAILLGFTGKLRAQFAEVELGVAPQREALLPLVSAAAAHDATTLAMLLALVLARMPDARPLLEDIATSLGPHGNETIHGAIEQALAVLLDRLESRSGIETLVIGSSIDQAGAEVRRIMALIEAAGLDAAGARMRSMTQRLDACCHLRFATALEAEFGPALQSLDAQPEPAAVARLENIARGLHNLEMEARRVGQSETYDELLHRAAALVENGALSLVDRVRLVEILVGPDEALALLDPAGTAI
jgi:hypothetical protein